MKISLEAGPSRSAPTQTIPFPLRTRRSVYQRRAYDGIEICGFPPHITLDKFPTTESRKELFRFLDDLKLGVSGYAADFSSINPVSAGHQAGYLDLFRRNTQMCVDLGSPTIRVDTVAAPGCVPDSDYEAAAARVAETWHKSAAIAQDAGIRMVWEFEPGFLSTSLRKFSRCIRRGASQLLDHVRHVACVYVRRGGSASAWREGSSARRRG